MRKIGTWVGVLFSLFQLYTAFFGTFDALLQRSIHLTLGLVILFLTCGAGKMGKRIGVIGALLSLAPMVYILLNYPVLQSRYVLITPVSTLELALGLLTLILVIEGTRRIVGMALVYLVLVFLLFAFAGPWLPGFFHHPGISLRDLVDIQFLSTEGIFGLPLEVSATYIAVFIIFAEFIGQTGIGNFMFDISARLTGRARGGPAKVAVVSSAIFGTISGSGTANVVTTGSITIPMMKKVGYQPHFAAAVEAVASTGGQIMPPVMAATAFVMSAYTGIPYITICRYAIFPAILYFTSIFIIVHIEADKFNLRGIEPERGAFESLKAYAHMTLPIFLLIYLLIAGYTPMFAGAYCVLATLILSFLRIETRMGLKKVLDSLQRAAQTMLVVIMACAAAGVIVGLTNFTGLGTHFSAAIVKISGGNIYVALIMTMVAALILGMGMPTTPAYVVQVALVVPALINMGLPVHVAHLFVFYFSCISLITPPVAVTAYAAAGIAGSDPWKTGWTAFKLGFAAFIVPYMFVFGPSLLLTGPAWEIITTVISAFIGVFSLAISLEGYWHSPLSYFWRVIAFAAALLLIFPGVKSSLAGFALLLLILFRERVSSFRARISSS